MTIRLVFVSIAALTLSYYNWLARAAGDQYSWKQDLPQYYCFLGRAFADGQLHLPMQPSVELLALKDPWDPALNAQWRLHDAVLYKSRYYLYHGPGPAVVLFAPWRLLTAHDVPENFAAMLLCFLAYLFLSSSLILLLRRAGAMPGPGLLALMLLVLAVGTGVPYLLVRVNVYEVAIAGAYFGVAGGWFFLVRGLHGGSLVWLVLSGLLLGVALSSRPHVGIAAGICSLLVLAWHKRWQGAIALGVPVVLSGVAILTYNYVRFDDPLEFGLRYLLAGERNQQRLQLSAANLYPGGYYMLFCPPYVTPVFPFVRLMSRLPAVTESLPQGYFFEPTAGALLLSPVLLALVLLPLRRRELPLVLGTLGTALGAFLFVIAIGFTTQRYQIDFVPLMVFAALICIGVTARRWMLAVSGVLCAFTIFVNAALAMTGPYDDILQRRPVAWVRIARWFSFVDHHKPLLNPPIAIAARLRFQKQQAGLLEPLIVLGHQAHRWMLYAEHTQDGIVLISASNVSSAGSKTLLQPEQQFTVRVEYDPSSKVITTLVNGEPRILHQTEGLVLARSQVQLGRNDTIPFFTYPKFTGTMDLLECKIGSGMTVR